jgi:hypothetical protein
MEGPHIADDLRSLRDYDDLILQLHPAAFGRGIPLFGASHKEFGLAMKSAPSLSHRRDVASLHNQLSLERDGGPLPCPAQDLRFEI